MTHLDEYLFEKTISGVSQRSIEGSEKEITDYFRLEPDITQKSFMHWVKTKLDNGCKITSLNHYISTLRTYAYWQMEKGYLKPYKIHLVKGQEPEIKYFNDDEVQALLTKPKNNSFVEWRTYVIVYLILSTGFRANTILNITVDDIKDDYIVIREQKNKKSKMLPLSDITKRVIKLYINKFGVDHYLFPDRTNHQMSYNALRIAFGRYCRARGVNRTNIHGLRHSFARISVRNGMNAFVLKEWLGHSTIAMTQKYVRLFSEDLTDTMKMLPIETLSKKSRF